MLLSFINKNTSMSSQPAALLRSQLCLSKASRDASGASLATSGSVKAKEKSPSDPVKMPPQKQPKYWPWYNWLVMTPGWPLTNHGQKETSGKDRLALSLPHQVRARGKRNLFVGLWFHSEAEEKCVLYARRHGTVPRVK